MGGSYQEWSYLYQPWIANAQTLPFNLILQAVKILEPNKPLQY